MHDRQQEGYKKGCNDIMSSSGENQQTIYDTVAIESIAFGVQERIVLKWVDNVCANICAHMQELLLS